MPLCRCRSGVGMARLHGAKSRDEDKLLAVLRQVYATTAGLLASGQLADLCISCTHMYALACYSAIRCMLAVENFTVLVLRSLVHLFAATTGFQGSPHQCYLVIPAAGPEGISVWLQYACEISRMHVRYQEYM